MKLFAVTCLLSVATLFSTSANAWPARRDLSDKDKTSRVSSAAAPEHGIKETIPDEFRDRYDRWKADLLSTGFGRDQWAKYENNTNFLLKIVVTSDKKFGAGTGDYKWDDKGKLIGATITLGKNLDRGFPDPVYYPVMNSLSNLLEPSAVKGNILASAKFAHEFGHVDQTAVSDGTVYQQQEKLMNAYYKIFLNNGYNTKDPRLVELAQDLGRQPIEIWEDREYWGEANAMRFLVAKMYKDDSSFCTVLGNIMRNVTSYAPTYETRFDQVAEANLPADACRR
jgi:hypothetical protein